MDLAEALVVLATHRPDVIALVRGGGSATDLIVFDAEVLARTIAGLDTPVVTGIGHEVDRAVADEVAHTAMKTPTACAAALVEQVRAFVDAVDGLRATIGDRARNVVDRADDRLGGVVRQTTAVATAVLNRHDDRLADLVSRIHRGPLTSLDHQAERLDAVGARVHGLDPARILTRGWSITRHSDGTLVRSIDDVSVGDPLVTTLEGGEVTSTVDSVTDGDRSAP
jgi:exodeoxyribonuclease VII large subunit